MKPVTTKQKQSTSLLPLFFEFKQELARKTATGEISRETSIFSVLRVLVALEVVLAGKTNGRRVLVACYLTSVGADLKSYFQWGLSEMCWRWHHAFQLGYALATKYSFDHLVRDEVLTLAGPVRCRGMTADVVFFARYEATVGGYHLSRFDDEAEITWHPLHSLSTSCVYSHA